MTYIALDTDPHALFARWLQDAKAHEPVDHNAMCLSTTGADGRPHARYVLLKGHDAQGFVFYTNTNSNKGRELAQTPYAALTFLWKSLKRQVRIEGVVEHVSDEEADAYFASRSRGKKTGAWASRQSQDLSTRDELARHVTAIEQRYADTEDIPRPPHWHGYRVVPDRFEFWIEGDNRLHDRLVYIPDNHGQWWHKRLYP
jgi:pyridoxamine 5'-phosphate oxidase